MSDNYNSINNLDPLQTRKRIINQKNLETTRLKNFDQYQNQENLLNKKISENEGPATFYKSRKHILFKKDYLPLTYSFVLLLINSIIRIIQGTYWYPIPAILFTITFIYASIYIDPVNFISNTTNYKYPKLNKIYLDVQHLIKILLTRLGKNLYKTPESSFQLALIIIILGSLSGVLFYNSGFVLLSVPILFLYFIRLFASDDINQAKSKLFILKSYLLLIITLNSFLSLVWKTPFGFENIILLSIVCSASIFFKNLVLYDIEGVNKIKKNT